MCLKRWSTKQLPRLNSSVIINTMNKTFDNYDTEVQCEEFFEQPQDSLMVLMWLTMQSLQVKVWNN